MCGRLNVVDDPLVHWICEVLGVEFTTQTNRDLRPTQTLDTIAATDSGARQLAATWGIKPPWAKKLIINAQAETVAEKPTFKKAFSSQRCIVPCTGWYEWRDEGGPRKQQYAFSHVDGIPLLMAGIWFDQPDRTDLVTLTTQPLERCAAIHHRMPLLIDPEQVGLWLSGPTADLTPIMSINSDDHIAINRV
jgi:putative SOS response-associated peptidase YedK